MDLPRVFYKDPSLPGLVFPGYPYGHAGFYSVPAAGAGLKSDFWRFYKKAAGK